MITTPADDIDSAEAMERYADPLREGGWEEVYSGKGTDLYAALRILTDNGCSPMDYDESGEQAPPFGVSGSETGRISVPEDQAQRAKDLLAEWERQRRDRRWRNQTALRRLFVVILAPSCAFTALLLLFGRSWATKTWAAAILSGPVLLLICLAMSKSWQQRIFGTALMESRRRRENDR